MKLNYRWIVLVPIVLVIALLFKGIKKSDIPANIEPAKAESVLGIAFKHVTLTAKAAERLGIETVSVSEEWIMRSDSVQKVVPYASVIYGLHGETWLYINIEPLVFVRYLISIDYIYGSSAVLLVGPPPGTKVVTVGVAELYGIDTGIGK